MLRKFIDDIQLVPVANAERAGITYRKTWMTSKFGLIGTGWKLMEWSARSCSLGSLTNSDINWSSRFENSGRRDVPKYQGFTGQLGSQPCFRHKGQMEFEIDKIFPAEISVFAWQGMMKLYLNTMYNSNFPCWKKGKSRFNKSIEELLGSWEW